VLSDVLGDDLATIGSGLTVADPSTFADALAVIDRVGVRARIPAGGDRSLEGRTARRGARDRESRRSAAGAQPHAHRGQQSDLPWMPRDAWRSTWATGRSCCRRSPATRPPQGRRIAGMLQDMRPDLPSR
jgi:hypothetical protein